MKDCCFCKTLPV